MTPSSSSQTPPPASSRRKSGSRGKICKRWRSLPLDPDFRRDDALFFLLPLLFLPQAVLVFFYLQAEHTFFFWDHAMYQNMAVALFENTSNRWAMFQASLSQEYSLIFALPSLITFSLFGAGREVFILTNFFAFFIPFQLASGLLLKRVMEPTSSSLPPLPRGEGRGEGGWVSRITRRITTKKAPFTDLPIPSVPPLTLTLSTGERGQKEGSTCSKNTQPIASRHPFLLAALFCSLIPSLWVPLLEGYPDPSAAALIVLALATGLNEKRGWKNAIAIGLTLAFAILLRRHFAYPALAIMIGLACADALRTLPSLVRTAPSLKRHPRESGDPEGLSTSTSGSYLWIPAFAGMTKKNIFCLLAFWALTATTLLATLLLIAPVFLQNALTIDYTALYASYKKPVAEFLVFLLGGYGYPLLLLPLAGLALAKNRNLNLLAAITLLEIILWCAGPAQAGHHYLIHLMPAFIVAGLTGLFLHTKKRWRALVIAFLVANTLWALALAPEATPPNNHGTPSLFSAPRPPIVRQDYDQLTALAAFLAQEIKPQDRVLALGSSFVFNQDLLFSVFKQTGRNLSPLYQFLTASEIDIKQGPPLDSFASATLYLVPTPAQYHLAPEGQKVVTAAADQFPPQGEKALLFHKIGTPFALDKNVSIQLWRRDPWTPKALDQTLSIMKKIAPWNQDWVLTQTPAIGQIGEASFQGLFSDAATQAELFFHHPLPQTTATFEARLQASETCRLQSAVLTLKTKEGKTLWQKPLGAALVNGLYRVTFQTEKDASLFLTLKAESQGQNLCSVLLSEIKITP